MKKYSLRFATAIFWLVYCSLLHAEEHSPFFENPETLISACAEYSMDNALQIDPKDVSAVEMVRQQKNKEVFASGDKFVFELGINFVCNKHSQKDSIKFIEGWNQGPGNITNNNYWKDVAYLYKYFASLEASHVEGKVIPRERRSYEIDFLNAITARNNGTLPVFFDDTKTVIQLGEQSALSAVATKTKILAINTCHSSFSRSIADLQEIGTETCDPQATEIGFLISGDDLRLDFLFYEGGRKINYNELNMQYDKIVADFPLPMHTGSGKLIELAIKRGEIVNYIFSGGGRRSGLVVIDRDGKSYPMHIQSIWPYLVNGKYAQAPLNLTHNYNDLLQFLSIAKHEQLSVVMEMLLLDHLDGQDLRSIPSTEEQGGRRMLVWKTNSGSSPVLLVLNNNDNNRLPWVAAKLGYQWGINCDVNYYDNAGYWEKIGTNYQRTRFSSYHETDNRGNDKLSYHRMVLYGL